jgi:hypothetical protein
MKETPAAAACRKLVVVMGRSLNRRVLTVDVGGVQGKMVGQAQPSHVHWASQPYFFY